MSCGGCAAEARSREQHKRACYAMCRYCPDQPECETYAKATVKGKFRTSVVVREMPAGGKTCRPKTRVEALVCPLGRWPDAQGLVHWRGMEWYGIPFPIRLRVALVKAWAVFRETFGADYLPGCGCIKMLKDRWEGWRNGVQHEAQVIDWSDNGKAHSTT